MLQNVSKNEGVKQKQSCHPRNRRINIEKKKTII